jgi:hypothetical protein
MPYYFNRYILPFLLKRPSSEKGHIVIHFNYIKRHMEVYLIADAEKFYSQCPGVLRSGR